MKNWKTTLAGAVLAGTVYLQTVDWSQPVAIRTILPPILIQIVTFLCKDATNDKAD